MWLPLNTTHEQIIDSIISDQNYAALLQLYNNKGLAKQVGRFFGTNNYSDLVKRLITNNKGEEIVKALQKAVPTLT